MITLASVDCQHRFDPYGVNLSTVYLQANALIIGVSPTETCRFSTRNRTSVMFSPVRWYRHPLSMDAINHDTTALQDFKRQFIGVLMDDDLVRAYALEAQKAMEEEANRRIAEQTDPKKRNGSRTLELLMLSKRNTSFQFCSLVGASPSSTRWHGGELQSQNGNVPQQDSTRSRFDRSVFVVRCRPGYARRCPKRFGKRSEVNQFNFHLHCSTPSMTWS